MTLILCDVKAVTADMVGATSGTVNTTSTKCRNIIHLQGLTKLRTQN